MEQGLRDRLLAYLDAELEKANALPPAPWLGDLDQFNEADGIEACISGDACCFLFRSPTDKPWEESKNSVELAVAKWTASARALVPRLLEALRGEVLSVRHLVVEGDCWFSCPLAIDDDGNSACCNEALKRCTCDYESRLRRIAALLGVGEEGKA